MSIKGKIFNIIPITVYQEKVYTQDVIVELNNGLKIAISDPSKYCKKEYINKIKNLKIKIFLASLTEKVDNCEIQISPAFSEKEPYQGPIANICGRIEQIVDVELGDVEHSYSILDVGVGTIKILYKDTRGLNLLEKNIDNLLVQKKSIFIKGAYIKIKGATLYLEGIE